MHFEKDVTLVCIALVCNSSDHKQVIIKKKQEMRTQKQLQHDNTSFACTKKRSRCRLPGQAAKLPVALQARALGGGDAPSSNFSGGQLCALDIVE